MHLGGAERRTGMSKEIESDKTAVESRFGMTKGDRPLVHANTLSPRLLDVTNRKARVAPEGPEENQLAHFSSLLYGAFGFTGTAFGQRGMPTSYKGWNTLLWLTRMAIIAGAIAYVYPRLRAQF